VGFSPEVVNTTKSKKENADREASKNSPIPGLVIVSTPEGIHFFPFDTQQSIVDLCYFCKRNRHSNQ
jgi:hypothetical protein